MLKHRGALPIVSFLVLASLFGIRPTGAGPLPPLANLAPGTDLRIQQTVDVNVVLVGFDVLKNAIGEDSRCTTSAISIPPSIPRSGAASTRRRHGLTGG